MFGIKPVFQYVPIEVALRIRRRQHLVNKCALYAGIAGVLTLATESLYRNIGGSPETANYIFQVGAYTLLGTGIISIINNQQVAISQETGSEKSNLESKVSNN